MSDSTIIIAIAASVIGGFLIRKNPESWRAVVQIALSVTVIIWAFITDGFIWAIITGFIVFITQGILMGIFRFIGINRLAKQMGIPLNRRD